MNETEDIAVSPESAPSASYSALGSQSMHEFVRYFAASLLALAADVAALFVLTSVAGVPYLYSAAAAFVLGLVVVYLLSILWVFERRSSMHPALEFLLFALIGMVGLGLNEGVLWVLTGIWGFYYMFSKIASVVVVFTWNFFARKFILFRA